MSMPGLTDRHGLALSTRSSSAVEHLDRGLDLQLSLNAGGVEGLTKAVEADPEFAVGHAALAFAHWYRANLPAAQASLKQAQALAQNTLPRERQQLGLLADFMNGAAA